MKISHDAMDIGLWGDFGLRVFDLSSGKPVETLRIRKKNQITNEGRTALLMLMTPGQYNDPGVDSGIQVENRIWSLGVGTDATPATVSDTESSMLANLKWISSFFYPTPGLFECQVIATPPNTFHLSISKTLPQTSSADTYTLTEAGIFTRGDADDPTAPGNRSLYARQTHSPIIKTDNMTIQYDWLLGITIQS